MTTATQTLHQLWRTLTQELLNSYDVHGVCLTIGRDVAQFNRTTVILALEEPNGRYHDVWITQPNGQQKQTRWLASQTNYLELIHPTQAQQHQKHSQPPKRLLNDQLWRIPQDQIIVTPFPYRQETHTNSPKGMLCLVDATADNPLTPSSLHETSQFLTTYIERAALRRQNDRQQIEFSLISEVSHSLASTLKLKEIFTRIEDDIRSILDVESISLALIDENTGKIVFVPDLMGMLFMEIPPIELDPGQGIAGWVAQHGQPLIVNDTYKDQRFYKDSDQMTGFHTKDILCVPLKSGQKVIGIIEAINKRNGEFTPHDLNLLDALSGSLTTSILNARLHQDVVSEKRRIETIFQSMSEGMLTIGADGYITAVNDALLTLIRHQREELIGHQASHIITLKNSHIQDFITEVMLHQNQEQYPQLACEIKQNGSYVPVLASGAAITNEDGQITEIVLAFSDLRQIREVERMRDDFFHNVVHELRTPLATILMYARLLIKGHAKSDTEKTVRFLSVIERESDRLQTMVRQMLQLAKLEAKEIQRSAGQIQLNLIFDEILPPMSDRASEKGLAFIQRIKKELPPIIGDRDTIYMIIKNLVENAIKFTLSGTVKVIATPQPEEKQIRIEVTDEGIGIPETALPNLFKRFYRTQTAVERGIAGTGIGLYMVKEGIEKHHGRLDVTSQEGQGTSFVVHFPIANI